LSVWSAGTVPPAAATSASVAHLNVKGMATVTSFATSIRRGEDDGAARSARSDGHSRGQPPATRSWDELGRNRPTMRWKEAASRRTMEALHGSGFSISRRFAIALCVALADGGEAERYSVAARADGRSMQGKGKPPSLRRRSRQLMSTQAPPRQYPCLRARALVVLRTAHFQLSGMGC